MADTDPLADLFAETTYQTLPFKQSLRALPAIVAMWEAGQAAPDDAFTIRSEVAAEDRAGGRADGSSRAAHHPARPLHSPEGPCARKRS
jgi:hypothetical protein